MWSRFLGYMPKSAFWRYLSLSKPFKALKQRVLAFLWASKSYTFCFLRLFNPAILPSPSLGFHMRSSMVDSPCAYVRVMKPPGHLQGLAIPKPGFPHALKHGGFPLRVCEGHEPPGHLQGLAIPKCGFPHALKHGGFPLRVCEGNEPLGTFKDST